MRLKLTIQPTVEPVSLEEAKLHLRVDSGDDNALITSLIKTARRFIESQTGKALIDQTWELRLDAAGETIPIPKAPLLSVVSKIEVISEAGVTSEVSSSLYNSDTPQDSPGRVKLKEGCTWPDHRGFDSFIVTFVAGYGATATLVPDELRQGILQLVGHYYEGRQGEELPSGIEAIIDSHRIHWL